MSALPSLPLLSTVPWHPWHVAVAATLLCVALLAVARAQRRRANEDWANAFFYSPSQKPKVRQRRQRWQDLTWAFLALTGAGVVASGMLYWLGPR